MRNENIRIRPADVSDAEELLRIYAPYVEKTAITFEYVVPSVEEFEERIRNILRKYPYILAEENGEILGYAYTSAFVGRAAYDWSAETSIYLKENKRGMGLGRKLYSVLEDISRMQNILNLNACIAYPEKEDRYLTRKSVRFHERLGYTAVGEFHKCGYKFGTWYNMMWMEKMIKEHLLPPAQVIAFPDLDRMQLRSAGVNNC